MTPSKVVIFCTLSNKSVGLTSSLGFTYVFPGNKRLFVANQLGSTVYILECAESLFSYDKYQLLNVSLEGDTTSKQPSIGRRTYHLAPDGKHIGYTNDRPDGLVMIVASLSRTATQYNTTDFHVVNPTASTSASDTSVQHFSNSADLTELKSFVEGGRSAIFVGQAAAQNPDQFKIDLATGAFTRLSTNPDWDEDEALSPDGNALLTHSWRTMNRIANFGLFEPALPLTALLNAAAAASHYVASRPGYACDLQPWLLPPDGDAAGPNVIGQPLAPYANGSDFVACNTGGQPVWSPDSTRVILQQRSFDAPPNGSNAGVLEFGPAPASLLIARLVGKPPTKGLPIVDTEVGDWAPASQAYKGNTQYNGSHVLPGKYATVNFTIQGTLIKGSFSAVYQNFSADGETFVHGTNVVNGSSLQAVNWVSELDSTTANGTLTGYQWGNISYALIQPAPASGDPTWTIEGPLRSSYRGVSMKSYGKVGACEADMPRPQKLNLEVDASGNAVAVVVWADIFGDVRPVQGATVSSGSVVAITNPEGHAVLGALRPGAMVMAEAGTFVGVSKSVPAATS